jgi:sugar phosphate isomerase/epimerase
MRQIKKLIQVSIPFPMLRDKYLDYFINEGINPEIGFDAVVLDHVPVSDLAGIARKLNRRSLSITFHAPFVDLSAGSSDPAVREITKRRFEQLLKIVPVFKPKTVVCHAGYEWKRYGYFREEWIEKSIKMWSWMGAAVKNEGGTLMLENVYEQSPDEIKILFESLKRENVCFCLDTGHQSAFSKASLEKWLYTLSPFLGQLHIHDNNGFADEHLGLGLGSIDFKKFFTDLKVLRDTPPVITLEPHSEDDLPVSLKYLEEIWPWE